MGLIASMTLYQFKRFVSISISQEIEFLNIWFEILQFILFI